MRISENLKRHIIENNSGYTLSHSIFIPLFVGQQNEIRTLQAGNLVLKSVANTETIQELSAQIPPEYVSKGDWDAVKAGRLVNLVDLLAKQTSLYPLPFEKDRFLKIDKKHLQLGDTALILPAPPAFLQRVRAALNIRLSSAYFLPRIPQLLYNLFPAPGIYHITFHAKRISATSFCHSVT